MFFLLCMCLLGMVLKSTHLLSFLIGLEFLGLVVFLTFFISYAQDYSLYMVWLFLLGVMGCESAMGLVLFVILTRFNSKDYLLGLLLAKF